MNIINFSKKEAPAIVMVQPDYSIEGYQPEITYHEGNESFRVSVGCQSLLITRKNISQIIDEIGFKPGAPITKDFIVKKKATAAKHTNPEYAEKSLTYFISKSEKLYAKTEHKILSATVTPTPKYFKGYGTSKSYFEFKGRAVPNKFLPDIRSIIEKIAAYYNMKKVVADETPSNEVVAQDKLPKIN